MLNENGIKYLNALLGTLNAEKSVYQCRVYCCISTLFCAVSYSTEKRFEKYFPRPSSLIHLAFFSMMFRNASTILFRA